jgi:hypothetical protein
MRDRDEGERRSQKENVRRKKQKTKAVDKGFAALHLKRRLYSTTTHTYTRGLHFVPQHTHTHTYIHTHTHFHTHTQT